jgi:ribosomal-protein-alanine acetyltransferase
VSAKFKIRAARIADLDRMLEIETAGFESDRFVKRQFRYLLTKARATLLIAESGGKIAGFAIMLWRKNSRSGRLYNIVIDPAFRGAGIGRRLLDACHRETRARDLTRINLEVRADNDRAITFYRNHGFRVRKTVRGYYSDGAAALKMTKEI